MCPAGTTPVTDRSVRARQSARPNRSIQESSHERPQRTATMTTAREFGAYLGLALLAVCVLCAGIVAAHITGGALALPAGAAAAGATFHALRRVAGRVIAAAVDSP
jgi:hypothetical protein